MFRRLALGTGLLLLALLVAIPCWIAATRGDLADPGDADLAVPRSELPPGSNGYERLVAAGSAIDWSQDSADDERLNAIRSGKAPDATWLAERMRRNRAALTALRDAARAAQMQLPLRKPPDDASLDVLVTSQRLVRLSGAGGRLQLERGDTAGAIESALLGLELGHRLSSAEGSNVVTQALAISLRTLGLQDLDAVARRVRVDSRTALELSSRLEAARANPADWARSWAQEYQTIKSALRDAAPSAALPTDSPAQDGSRRPGLSRAAGWLPEDYVWQPNRTLAGLANVYRERQQAAAHFCCELRRHELTADDLHFRILRGMLAPNPAGRFVVEIARSNLSRFDLRRCHGETRISLVQALLGVRAYWLSHGRLPERLGDLVPDYLPAVPLDHFTGLELHYDFARKRVYSLGDDFAEGGGDELPDPANVREPSLSVAF